MTDSPTTTELIEQARGGDRRALERLLERHREFLRVLVRCRCRGPLQARLEPSDLIQETMLRVAQHFDQFEGSNEAAWRAWLTRIAEREVIGQYRHHVGAAKRAVGRERALDAVPPSGSRTGSPRLDAWLAQTRTTPSLAAIRKEQGRFVTDALAQLPPDYREVLILRHLEELPFAEIAARMQRSDGAVRVLWVRALKKLREVLNDSSLSSDPGGLDGGSRSS